MNEKAGKIKNKPMFNVENKAFPGPFIHLVFEKLFLNWQYLSPKELNKKSRT